MPGGQLRRADSELVILRVAHNCGSEYEWGHHARLGELAGLTREEIERVRSGPGAAGWTERQELLLRAADELHGPQRTVSEELWGALAAEFEERELIELCMLVGHYEMLAMTLNALHVRPDSTALSPPGRVARAVEALASRRRRRRPPAGRS
jgi:alkylhydroperoxidase family enzyme